MRTSIVLIYIYLSKFYLFIFFINKFVMYFHIKQCLTSFLTYYQFCYTNSYNILANYKDFLEIPIIGILPLKLEDNIWLTRIIKGKIKLNIDDKNKALSNNIVEFKFLLEKSIVINILIIVECL